MRPPQRSKRQRAAALRRPAEPPSAGKYYQRPTARACVLASVRRAHDDAEGEHRKECVLLHSTHTPPPIQPKAPRRAHADPMFEARDVPYASFIHAVAPKAPLLAQVLSRERTFSLSQPSGPHAALAATTTRQKMRQDFIILFAVLLLGEDEQGVVVVRCRCDGGIDCWRTRYTKGRVAPIWEEKMQGASPRAAIV